MKTETKMNIGAWLSFADAHKPRGSQFVGVAIVKANEPNAAVAACIELGIWPEGIAGLDVEILPVDLDNYEAVDLNRMLNRADAERLGVKATVNVRGNWRQWAS